MTQDRASIAVVIPARNEEASIGSVLESIPHQLPDVVVVCDNGSSDRTAEVAREAGARVVRESRPGYGAACLAALEAVPPSTDVVVFLDADFSDDPGEMPRLISRLVDDRLDLVIGSRVRRAEPGALLPQARFGNWLATRLIRLFFGYRFTDLGPFRAITWNALQRLQMSDRGMGWTVEMQIKAARLGLRTGEVDVSYRKRIGVSKITGTLSGTIRAGCKILWLICKHGLTHRFGSGRSPSGKPPKDPNDA